MGDLTQGDAYGDIGSGEDEYASDTDKEDAETSFQEPSCSIQTSA